MTALSEVSDQRETQISKAARELAAKPNLSGAGRGVSFCVRLTPQVESMLHAAKASKQSMPEFLREAGITVALQRLADSQN